MVDQDSLQTALAEVHTRTLAGIVEKLINENESLLQAQVIGVDKSTVLVSERGGPGRFKISVGLA